MGGKVHARSAKCLASWQMSVRLAMCMRGRQCAWAGRKSACAVGKVHGRSEKCLGGWLNVWAVGKVPGLVGKMPVQSAKMSGRLAKRLRWLANVWAVGNVPGRLAMCMRGRQKYLSGWQCACAGRQKYLGGWLFRDFQQEKTFWAIFTVSMASFP